MIHVGIPATPDFEFLVVFAVILAGPLVVSRFKVPGLIGMLLGGLLIGSHCFGFIGSGNTTIPDVGNLGLLYLMFMAGLELDLKMVNAHRRDTGIYSLLTLCLPMGLGVVVARWIGFDWPAAILLGSLLASHTLVVLPTIKEMGRGDNRAVTTGVGATVVTDTITLVVLAVIQGLTVATGQSGAGVALQIVVGLVVLGVGSFLVLPPLARWFLGRFGTARTTRYVFALAAMLAVSSLGDAFGIDGIIGAFFAGLALNQVVPNEGDLMQRLDFFGGAFFIPVFLVSVGLRIVPSVMVQPGTLEMAAWFIAACFGGKALAAVLTRPLLRYNWPEAGVLFSLTIPQAAATLAAAQIGWDIGLFSNEVLNAILVLIAVSLVLSAVIVPIFTRKLDEEVSADYQPGKRVLFVVAPETGVRRPVAELAVRFASSDGGVVIPTTVVNESRAMFASTPQDEAWLVAVGIDRPMLLVMDADEAAAIRHSIHSFRATSVIVDDPTGALHDHLRHLVVEPPVFFVGPAGGGGKRARVVAHTAGDEVWLADAARRMARAVDGTGESTDLLVQAADTPVPISPAADITVVRMLRSRDGGSGGLFLPPES